MQRHFAELTRQYDTWEWKTKYNNELPHELILLFDVVGCDGYIELMSKKSANNLDKPFEFSDFEKMLIANKQNQVQEKLDNYVKNIYQTEVFIYKAGIIFIDYEYRNDLADISEVKG